MILERPDIDEPQGLPAVDAVTHHSTASVEISRTAKGEPTWKVKVYPTAEALGLTVGTDNPIRDAEDMHSWLASEAVRLYDLVGSQLGVEGFEAGENES